MLYKNQYPSLLESSTLQRINMSIPSIRLSDGHDIPALGYGAGRWLKFGEHEIQQEAVDTIALALELGITHVDGAEVYNTEIETGMALKIANRPRESLFLTTKYFSGMGDYSTAVKSNASSPYEALKISLKKLQLEYVDLYLLHSQHIKKEIHGFTIAEAWKDLERLKDEGYTKSIGVSNFNEAALAEILETKPKYIPVVNQIEYSPYIQNQTDGIVEYSRKHGITIEGYAPLSPLTHKAKEGEDTQLVSYLEELAIKYNRSTSQVILRWVYQQGVVSVTSSNNVDRIKSYFEVFTFEITPEEQKKINELGSLRRLQTYLDLGHNH